MLRMTTTLRSSIARAWLEYLLSFFWSVDSIGGYFLPACDTLDVLAGFNSAASGIGIMKGATALFEDLKAPRRWILWMDGLYTRAALALAAIVITIEE